MAFIFSFISLIRYFLDDLCFFLGGLSDRESIYLFKFSIPELIINPLSLYTYQLYMLVLPIQISSINGTKLSQNSNLMSSPLRLSLSLPLPLGLLIRPDNITNILWYFPKGIRFGEFLQPHFLLAEPVPDIGIKFFVFFVALVIGLLQELDETLHGLVIVVPTLVALLQVLGQFYRLTYDVFVKVFESFYALF